MSQTLKQKTELLTQLATMHEAGISPDQAVAALRRDAKPAYRKRLQAMQRHIQNGSGIADAGEKSGVLETFDAIRVRIAETSGDTAKELRTLADEFSRRMARVSRIRSRLMMPVLVLFLAAFIRPFPALVNGDLDIFAYLRASVGMLLLFAMLAFLILRLLRSLDTKEGRNGAAGRVVDHLALRLPLFRTLTPRREQTRFLTHLSHLLEAGLGMQQAVPIALDAIRNQTIREDYASIEPDLELGDTFTQAFSRCVYAKRDAVQHLNVAEMSGTLPTTLKHFAAIEQEQIDASDDQISLWVPRIIYALIVAWIVPGLL